MFYLIYVEMGNINTLYTLYKYIFHGFYGAGRVYGSAQLLILALLTGTATAGA